MAITILSSIIMPASVIVAGLSGSNRRSNTRAVNQGGYGTINVGWHRTLREFDLGFIPMLASEWRTIEGLHEATAGGAYGFLLEDPKDCTVSATEGLLQPQDAAVNAGVAGAGYGVPTYRLYKRYSAIGSALVNDRYIGRPQPAGLQLLRNGAAVTLGSAPGNAAISGNLVTFVADQSASVTAVTVGATTSVTLASGIGLASGGRLFLSDLLGADAALLNGRSHSITSLVGNVYTLATNTAGKLITGGGTGYRYPQASQALAWTGRFYVPVHFAADDLPWQLVRGGAPDTRLIVGQSITLQEVREVEA